MKVIVAGARDYHDYMAVYPYLERLWDIHDITEFVSGGAMGVDNLGERYAKDTHTNIKRFPANWEEHGRAAGPMRNQRMAEYADVLIAFPRMDSKGTKDMISKALAHGLEVHVYPIERLED